MPAVEQIISDGEASGGTGKYGFGPIERANRTGHLYLDHMYDLALAQSGYIEMGFTTEGTHESVIREFAVVCQNEQIELRLYEGATYTQVGDGVQLNMNRNEAATHPSVIDVTDDPVVTVQGYPVFVQQWLGINDFRADPVAQGKYNHPIVLKDNTQYVLRLTFFGANTGFASVDVLRCECPYHV